MKAFFVILLLLTLAARLPAADTNAPVKTFDVRNYGAKGDGLSFDTTAIQSAINACAAAGGGRVELPGGTYLTKPLILKGNNLTFQIDDGAILQGSDQFADYDKPDHAAGAMSLISAKGLTNLTLLGPGTIDGAGDKWWPEVRAAKKSGQPEPRPRPRLVSLSHCPNLRVENITLQSSPSFHLVPADCENVTIDSVNIRAPADSPNTDAIDPYNCRHLHIFQCVLDVGDDNIALKSGSVDPDHPLAACSDILVESCTFQHGHGLSIGSETVGGIKDLTVRNCVFLGTTSGIRIKSGRKRGGTVSNCVYSDLVMTDVKTPVNISCYYPKVPATDTNQPVTDLTPHFQDITITNLTATGAEVAGQLIGLPESPVDGFLMEHVTITAQTGFAVRNARKVRFKAAAIATADGHAFTMQNAQILGFGNNGQ